MNPILDSLIKVVETEPLPERHTSSHWQRYGKETIVQRRGETLNLRASGFAAMYPKGPASAILGAVERLSYRRVAGQLRYFPQVWMAAKRLADDLGCGTNFYVFRSVAALAVLMDHWNKYQLSPKRFAIIGDGFGFLGALVRRMVPASRLYSIDLPKTLIFQVRAHEQADPKARMARLTEDQASGDAELFFVLPQEVERASGTIDCAINIASMQEMNAFSVAGYFDFLRQRSGPDSHFYAVNREHKVLPGGEVSKFAEYPWSEKDTVFIDGPCPYYTHCFSMYTLPKGPRMFGLRVPFVNYFDGLLMHRLVHLASEA